MQAPSHKKLGKRPELHEAARPHRDMARSTPRAPSPGVQQQKRVLPSRSRRGGACVGKSRVDLLILATEKRIKDARPAIPPNQLFFLTTNSNAVPPPPPPPPPPVVPPTDPKPAHSYFDVPSVKIACIVEQGIQVPEFSPLPDDAVAGRLRARAEEEGSETSDEAYINRHRKYETFEKRQRRREKEKLVHERYKLKERIEQLKAIDVGAFGPGGETRRKEMLEVAEGLETRYAVLLPPDPKRMRKVENKRKRSEGPRAGTTTADDADTEEEVVERPAQGVARPASTGPRVQQVERANVRQPLLPSGTSMTPAVSVALAANVTEPRGVAQYTYDATTVPTRPSSRGVYRVRDSTARFPLPAKSERELTSIPEHPTPEAHPPSPPPPPPPPAAAAAVPENIIVPPPRKRQRVDPQLRRDLTPDNPPITSVLLQIAARKAAQPQARQTSRTTLAFGFRLPPDVEDATHYEVPPWLISQKELERIHDARTRSATRSASPNPVLRVPNGVGKHADVIMAAPPNEVVRNGTKKAMAVDETRRAALPTSSIREENGMVLC